MGLGHLIRKIEIETSDILNKTLSISLHCLDMKFPGYYILKDRTFYLKDISWTGHFIDRTGRKRKSKMEVMQRNILI